MVYHVPAHSVLSPPGNQKEYQLAQVQYIEERSDPQEVAHRLRRKTGPMGVHTLQEIATQMGVNLTDAHIKEACQECAPCSRECKGQLP